MRIQIKIIKILTILILTLGIAGFSYAVPVLQVGAPAGPGDSGSYADYLSNVMPPGTLSDPDADTAVTSGNTILAAGTYGPKTVAIGGGNYSAAINGGAQYSPFDGHGAILLVAVPDGLLTTAISNLTINGNFAFYSSSALSNLFPNNHYPLKDSVSDFLFYDIGSFSNSGTVPNFVDESGFADGEIKTLLLGGTTGLTWIHFDLMALETTQNGSQNSPTIKTTFQNSANSHDLTWQNPGGGPPHDIPEPSTYLLVGIGLIILSLYGRKLFKR